MENKILDLLYVVLRQIKEELLVSNSIFTDDTIKKVEGMDKSFRIIFYELERDYFDVRSKLSQININVLNHDGGNSSTICNISNALNDSVKVLDEIKNINATTYDHLSERGLIDYL